MLDASLGVADSIRPVALASSDAYTAAAAKGQQARKQGLYAEANSFYGQAAQVARQDHNKRDEARALHDQSGCHIRLFQYRQALSEANSARDLARLAQDDLVAGASANNRATVYQQLGDFALAESASHEAVDLLEHSGRKDFFVSALVNYGDILALGGKSKLAIAVMQRAVSVARDNHLDAIEAEAQDHLADTLIDIRDYPAAARALDRALQLHTQLKDQDAAQLTRSNQAVLAYDQGDYQGTLALLHQITGSRSLTVAALPPFWEPKLRGEALLGLGRQRPALAELENAIRLAGVWRRSSLPSDATSTRTLVLLHEVYQEYISLAADIAIEHRDPVLARRALSVLMEHRASTLREQMLSALGREMRLPPRYFELVSKIQAAQAAVTLAANSKDLPARRAGLEQLRIQLAEMENSIGLQDESRPETARAQTALARVQKHLLAQDLLLSFSLGREKSFVWAVTSDKVDVYELPSETVLAAHAKAFSDGTRHNAARAEGELLSRELFGKVSLKLARRPEWLIAADGALLNSIPFAALPDPEQKQMPIVNSHALRFLPSELLLAQDAEPTPAPRFLGVADPIYNLADARQSRHKQTGPVGPGASVVLARLAGSEREVRSAAALNGFRSVDILTGQAANDQNLRAVLATAPQVLHFAVHVVSPEAPDGSVRGEEAALALSLGNDHLPQLLTKETIATLRVPGTLVVLSGCASQQGQTLPSAGLMGLSRAWLLAGAAAVVTTAWPTPDDSGKFFSKFYAHLQAADSRSPGSIAERAASALQLTQLEMQHSQDFLGQPSFWAAYSVISKE